MKHLISQVAQWAKNPPGIRDVGDMGSVPGWGRSPGGGNGNPLHCSCLDNPMDRGAWRAMVHRLGKNETWLKWLSVHAHVKHLSVTNESCFLKTELRCCSVGSGSYSSILCYKMNIHLTWLCRKLRRDGYIEQQQLTLCGEISYNVSNTSTYLATVKGPDRRRQWHPIPVLSPGKSHGRRSLVGCSPWGR